MICLTHKITDRLRLIGAQPDYQKALDAALKKYGGEKLASASL
jgi:hypothetical protein